MWIRRLENEDSKKLQNIENTNSMYTVLSFQNRIKNVNKLRTKQKDSEDMKNQIKQRTYRVQSLFNAEFNYLKGL